MKRKRKRTKDYQSVRFILHVSEPSAKHHIHLDKLTKHSNQHYLYFDSKTWSKEKCYTSKKRESKRQQQTKNAILEGKSYLLYSRNMEVWLNSLNSRSNFQNKKSGAVRNNGMKGRMKSEKQKKTGKMRYPMVKATFHASEPRVAHHSRYSKLAKQNRPKSAPVKISC